MSQPPCTLVHEEHKFMLMKDGSTWQVISVAPYVGGPLYYMDDVDIDKFVAANHSCVTHTLIKREYIDILHAQPKDGFHVFKQVYIVENNRLLGLFLDYSGCYGLYTCDKHGWQDRLICYSS